MDEINKSFNQKSWDRAAAMSTPLSGLFETRSSHSIASILGESELAIDCNKCFMICFAAAWTENLSSPSERAFATIRRRRSGFAGKQQCRIAQPLIVAVRTAGAKGAARSPDHQISSPLPPTPSQIGVGLSGVIPGHPSRAPSTRGFRVDGQRLA